MLLTIIIPLYNTEAFIKECLDSILAQQLSVEDFEVIVVDDGSTDKGPEIVSIYAEKFENFTLLKQANQGNGIARETGLKIAKGKYIYFFDSDDYVLSNTLKPLLDIATRENVDILRFNAKSTPDSFDSKEQPAYFDINQPFKVITGLEFLATNFYGPEVWYYFIKKDLIAKNHVSFVENHYIQDSFYTPLVYTLAKRTIDTGFDVYRYRQNIHSVTRKKTDAHIKKYNKSIEYGIERINDIRNAIPANEPYAKESNRMLKIKQQWYCVLYIIRFARSSNKTKLLNEKLKKMKTLGAFPLNSLNEGPYNTLQYKIITKVFNNKSLRNIFVHVYRTFYQITK